VSASTRLPQRSMREDAEALTISTLLTFEVELVVAAPRPEDAQ
jgi:hypothetical protein